MSDKLEYECACGQVFKTRDGLERHLEILPKHYEGIRKLTTPNITVKIWTVSASRWNDRKDVEPSPTIELKVVDSDVSVEEAIRFWEEETKFRLVEVIE